MDNLQAFITSSLPPSVLAHMTRHSSSYWKFYQSFISARNTAYTYLSPLQPMFDSVQSIETNLTTFILLGIVLILTLAIYDMLRSVVAFWVRLIYRVVFWGGLAMLGLWMWQRGVEGVVVDLQGGFEWVMDYWNESYKGYKQQEELAKIAQRLAGGDGRGKGMGGWFGR